MNITVVGTGYVGLSLAVLLSTKHRVRALDILQSKVDLINNKKSPIKDTYIENFLFSNNLDLFATTDKTIAYEDTELVIIATPTNYDEETQYFDTSSVESVISDALNYNVPIVIKSTIPVGFVENMRKKFNSNNIYFSPEFLREGQALYDNLYPSRIIVGDKGPVGQMFSNLLKDACLADDVQILLTNPTEAEAIKLFANTYLAARVAYFNELDNYCYKNNLNTKDIITGMCLDPRIGNYYNNPSFGFGGLCFPKDSKQLLANFKKDDVQERMISAIIGSNHVRKSAIALDIKEKCPNGVIGIYKTSMKANSDNNRSAAILDIIRILINSGREVIVYEPYNDVSFLNCEVEKDFNKFIDSVDIIVANRMEDVLIPFSDKVFTRDIFNNN